MKKLFLNSDTKKSQLFIFAQTLSESSTFQNILEKFENNFDKENERNWLQFWTTYGEQFLLDLWTEKYEDSLVLNGSIDIIEGEEETEIAECANKSDTDTTEESVAQIDDGDKKKLKLQLLWEQHHNQVWYELQNLHSAASWNYRCELNQALQYEQETIRDKETDKFNNHKQLINEFKQLQLLGLPTSFGRQKGKHNKSKNFDNMESSSVIQQKLTTKSLEPESCPYFNFLSSDEDSEGEHIISNQLHKTQNNVITKKKKNNRRLRKVPSFLLEGGGLIKYWHKRFSLFSRYDEGIQLDKESWFSVTPEQIAIHIAERLRCDVAVDGFCGCGGNTIQLAKTCEKVIAVDIDPEKIKMAQHNANIYGVAHKIEFIVGDFLQFCDNGNFKADAVFVSPPWGGPSYKNKKRFNIEEFLLPVGASVLIEKIRKITTNVALFLPRNSDMKQIIKLAGVGKQCEVQHNYLDTRLVAITALYGDDLIKPTSNN